ncbi:MAG: hypothetical protein K0Q60_3756 [Microvirga sp.]|jgi:hypothetical protein|nr:hypothetical protein [Microvirga sp.]
MGLHMSQRLATRDHGWALRRAPVRTAQNAYGAVAA